MYNITVEVTAMVTALVILHLSLLALLRQAYSIAGWSWF
jgi:hypothetical protein